MKYKSGAKVIINPNRFWKTTFGNGSQKIGIIFGKYKNCMLVGTDYHFPDAIWVKYPKQKRNKKEKTRFLKELWSLSRLLPSK